LKPANAKLVGGVGESWPKIKGSGRRGDVLRIVEKTRLDLLIAKAKGLTGDAGVRLLIEEKIPSEVILEGLDITAEKLAQVNADIEKERAEKKRVKGLLEDVGNKTLEERVKHLLDKDVSDALIIELAEVDEGALADIKKSIEEELKEKQRLAEEEAARKKAEAAGPALEDIEPEKMLEYIESIREILEFSDQEKDIRIMCEQSSIPVSLVDVAVSDPDRLDELEKEAEG
jgi:polyribonucleotide nucleotidyltransferase